MRFNLATLKNAYKTSFGTEPEITVPLPPTASNRLYYRLSSPGTETAIGCYNPDRVENSAFFYITERLKAAGVKVPELYYVNEHENIYLQQDLGDIKLFDLVDTYRQHNSAEYINWYKKVIDSLPKIQYESAKDFDFSKCFPRESFDKQSIQWDLNYFKYYFLKLTKVPFHEQKLEDDFNRLTEFLLEAPSDFFLFRDLQSRNIMIHENDAWFIDYQGGRRGALQYDLASLLYEAKVNLSAEERDELLKHYLHVYQNYPFFNPEIFMKYFPAFILIRLLQAFGAYGYRGYFEQKSLFLQSIPYALNNLEQVLTRFDLGVELPHLKATLETMIRDTQFENPLTDSGKLLVRVNSFSYKKGIPQDLAGHGGGFVFDCRFLPNPGRLEEYKTLTGKDQPVIQYLESKNEVKEFIAKLKELIEPAITGYIQRGHEHLMLNFGCTGGQHRSVYCAEQIAQYLRERFPINIILKHTEQEKS